MECQSAISGQTNSTGKGPTAQLRLRLQQGGMLQFGSKIMIPPIPPSQPVLPEPNRSGRRGSNKKAAKVTADKPYIKVESSSVARSDGYHGDKSDEEEDGEDDDDDDDDDEDGFEYDKSRKKGRKDFAPVDPNDLDEVQKVERRYVSTSE